MTGIVEKGLIAVVRAATSREAELIALGLSRAGIQAIEITCTVPGAPDVIRKLVGQVSGLVGAGTVLTVDLADACIRAGAKFLVAPNTNEDVIRYGLSRNVDVIPGALTPTEIRHAVETGVDVIKVYPIGAVGGPSYVRALLEPYPGLRLAVSGAIKVSEVKDYMTAGAWNVCLGGALIDRVAAASRDIEGVERKARAVLAELELAGVSR